MVAAFCILCCLSACTVSKETKLEVGELLTVEGTVTKVEHTDSVSGKVNSGFSVTGGFHTKGMEGTSMTMDDDTQSVPEKFLVHIQIPNGSLVVDRRDLFEKLKEGEKLFVSYREEYFVTYDYDDKVIAKRLKRLIFFDAIPK